MIILPRAFWTAATPTEAYHIIKSMESNAVSTPISLERATCLWAARLLRIVDEGLVNRVEKEIDAVEDDSRRPNALHNKKHDPYEQNKKMP